MYTGRLLFTFSLHSSHILFRSSKFLFGFYAIMLSDMLKSFLHQLLIRVVISYLGKYLHNAFSFLG